MRTYAATIRDGCRDRGWTLRRLEIDRALSGAEAERPALYRALDRIAWGGASTLVVPDVVRLSRDVGHWVELLDWFDECHAQTGGDVYALDMATSVRSEPGRSAAYWRVLAAPEERRRARASTKAGCCRRPLPHSGELPDPRRLRLGVSAAPTRRSRWTTALSAALGIGRQTCHSPAPETGGVTFVAPARAKPHPTHPHPPNRARDGRRPGPRGAKSGLRSSGR